MSSSSFPGERPRRRRIARVVLLSLASALVVSLTVGFFVYRHLEDNITALDLEEQLGEDRPALVVPTEKDVVTEPLNVLVLGSDTRKGQSAGIGGKTPGLSDTTILLHLSADRERAYGVSIPRDAMVQRPECVTEDGAVAGGLSMFNEAYAVGGPACTIRTVEAITDIRVDHFVVVDFDGFKAMVDALDGVPVCVPEEVNDDIGNIHLPAGSYEVKGEQALNYVRLRHELSENGDIGRMKRQQAFLAAMANKAISAGTLANPVRLYNFLDAATSSLTTDPKLADLGALAGLAKQVQDIGLDNVAFLTVPFETYPPDPNRLQIAPAAERLWDRLRMDQPLSPAQERAVTTAAQDPDGGSAGTTGSGSPGKKAGGPAAPAPSDAARTENGLCA